MAKRPNHSHDQGPPPEGTIEQEFGEPIPGKVLAPELWCQTALKKLPPLGFIDIDALFGRQAPLIVDVGCGNGRYSLGSALDRRDFDHLAADLLPVVIRYATRRGNQRGLTNLRFCVVDGERLVTQLLPAARVRELHCYHPQPYPGPGEGHGRMIQPFFLAEVIRVLEPEGLFVVQTDNDRYWHDIRTMAEEFFDFQHHPARWPDAPRGRSRREIYALQKGMPIYRGIGKPKAGFTYEEALIRAGNLTRRGSKEKIGAVAPSAKQDSTRTPPRHCPDGP